MRAQILMKLRDVINASHWGVSVSQWSGSGIGDVMKVS